MLSSNDGTISREEITEWCKKHGLRPAHVILAQTPIVPEYYSISRCFRTPNYSIEKLIIALEAYKPRRKSDSLDFRIGLIKYLKSINV